MRWFEIWNNIKRNVSHDKKQHTGWFLVASLLDWSENKNPALIIDSSDIIESDEDHFLNRHSAMFHYKCNELMTVPFVLFLIAWSLFIQLYCLFLSRVVLHIKWHLPPDLSTSKCWLFRSFSVAEIIAKQGSAGKSIFVHGQRLLDSLCVCSLETVSNVRIER